METAKPDAPNRHSDSVLGMSDLIRCPELAL